MNKKLLSLLVPVLGGMAIVGSGFSAWHFGEVATSHNDTTTGNGTITEVVEFGEATLKFNVETFNLTLDQDALVGATDYADKGITADTLTYTLTMDTNRVNYLKETGYSKVDFSIKVTDTTNLDYYVTTSLSTKSAELGTSITGNVTFAWKAKPTTKEAYDAMVEALNSTTNATSGQSTFTFTLELTATLSKAA